MRALKSRICTVGVKKNLCPKKKKEKIIKYNFLHLSPHVYLILIFYHSAIVMPLYQIFLHFWIILHKNTYNFDLLNWS